MLSIQFGSRDKTLKFANIDLFCYVLDNKQRVFTRDSIQKVIGYDGKSETWLIELLTTINRFTPLYSELMFEIKTPLVAKIRTIDNENDVYGLLEVSCLLKSSLAIVKANEDGFLNVNQLKFAKSASIVLEKIQETALEDLIDEATGLNWFREKTIEKVIQIFLKQLNDEAFYWIRTIPIDFVEKVLDLHGLDWKIVFYNPYLLAKIVNEIVFSRISDEILDDLRTTKPKRIYKRKNNKKQDNEHFELKKFIIALESLLTASGNNRNNYLQLLNKVFPIQKNRTGFSVEKVTTDSTVSVFNESLIKSFAKKSFDNNKKTHN